MPPPSPKHMFKLIDNNIITTFCPYTLICPMDRVSLFCKIMFYSLFSDYVKNIHQENNFVILFHCVEYHQLTIMRKYKTTLQFTFCIHNQY